MRHPFGTQFLAKRRMCEGAIRAMVVVLKEDL